MRKSNCCLLLTKSRGFGKEKMLCRKRGFRIVIWSPIDYSDNDGTQTVLTRIGEEAGPQPCSTVSTMLEFEGRYQWRSRNGITAMGCEIDFSEIGGFRLGHAEDLQAATGCTVVLCEEGATAGVDVRGGAPGTRETDLLKPENLVEQIHAVLLTGGSAFGLDAAAGVMTYLEERGIGFDVGVARVPIVCGAALFDLAIGDHRVRPDRAMGYRACLAAGEGLVAQGSVGAGAGATIGKIRGMERAMKSGIGAYALAVGELRIGAVVAVNCLGDVIDPQAGRTIAGLLADDRLSLADTEAVMLAAAGHPANLFSSNTTIGVVASNGAFSKAHLTKLASMAQNGLARTLRPAHSMFDGDTLFALSTGSVPADLSALGMLAARVVERAVIAAVVQARSLCGLPCHADLSGS
jgi:L-aminopeptidase/D-esterase-like protein